ncbi:MAG: glycosyltransferase family 4 protein [Verrucomicrobiae bacterium]|nr:glycosyltransferase family 4 protein [Verrucomicrobiae bacterium]
MRVAVLHRSLEAEIRHLGEEGGTSLQLLLALRDLGVEVLALTQSPHPERFADGKIGGLPAVVWHETRRDPGLALLDKGIKLIYHHRKLATDTQRARRALAERGPFDVVWAYSEEPDGLVAGVLRALGNRIPLVIGIQALRYGFQDGRPHFIEKRSLQFGFRRARRIVANSPMVAEDLRRHYGVAQEKLTWIPHNLTRRFLRSIEAPQLRRSGSPTVLFLGAINEKKGADVFLDAAARLSRERPDLLFRMIGGVTDPRAAWSRAWAQRVARGGLGPRLAQLGHLPPEKVMEEIRAAAVVVLPSRMDEFSRAAVEALALGTPVVMTERMGAAFYPRREDSGVVVPPGNAEALASGMREVLDKSGYAERAAASARALGDELSPERVAAQWRRALGEAANGV